MEGRQSARADGASSRPAWAAFARALPDPLVLLDDEGRVLYANPAAEHVFGYGADEIVGINAMQLVHPDDLWEAADALRRRVEESHVPPVPRALRVRRGDGSWVATELIGSNHLDDPDIGGVVVTLRDISARVDLAQALEESERRFHAVVRHASEVVLLLDGQGIVRYASAALVPTTGWRPEDLIGSSGLELVHPDDLDRLVAEVAPLFAQPGAQHLVEYRLRNRMGAWRHCESLFVNMLAEPAVGRVALYVRDITARKEMADALGWSEQRFRSLVANSSDVTLVYREDGVITYVSPSIERVMGYDPAEQVGRPIREFIHPDDLLMAREWLDELLSVPGSRSMREIRMIRADGQCKTFEASITNLVDDAAIGGLVANARDISDRKAAEAARADSEARFRSAFESAPIGMALQDLDGRFLMVNRALCELLGYSPEELMDRNGLDLTHPDHRDEQLAMRARVQRGELSSYQLEKRFVRSDGGIVWAKLSVSCIADGDGAPHYAIAQIEDITGRRRDEERLTHQALHDALTGLPNRALLLDRLAHALDRHEVGSPTAVLFCDLDRFKVVNDSDGHQVGDRLLVECGERLRGVVRQGDTVARFGGDEFVILATGLQQRDEAIAIARRVLAALEAAFVIDGREFFVSTSIGIAFADGGSGPDDLVRDADAAMYRAKERGRGSFVVFEPEMRSSAQARAELERSLRRALDGGELRLHYQPLVEIGSGAVVGAEALVRWAHPDRGLVPPGEFVPLAEDTGLILPLGRWVVAEACERVARWERDALLPAGFRVTVNLSLRQLAEPGFAGEVAATMRRAGVDPARLCFEVTESALADDGGVAVSALRSLRGLGVGLAIDDFGTGYSALSHLKRFPFDTIKIDRSFIDGLGRDAEDEAIVAAIIGIARALGLDVIAEGIETSEQADALVARGVHVGQGFLYSPAVPEHLFVQLLGVLAA
ncbi:MAG TPA: PAS domain S-box protein [Acidimicrobiia bacterium]|nr:PAS domain S-box protein [Acidimicrobiia bacterium]